MRLLPAAGHTPLPEQACVGAALAFPFGFCWESNTQEERPTGS